MTAANLNTKNKVGYLNPKTGRYMYAFIEEVNVPHPKTQKPSIRLRVEFPRLRNADHIYWEETENLDRWSKENSIDFKSEKKLVKFI